jgi:hypothetical protein
MAHKPGIAAMKKPWVIGLISILPGLGFIVLGKIIQGLIVFIVVGYFALLGYLINHEEVSVIFYTLALIAWITQLYYAISIARRSARVEAGLVTPGTPVSMASLTAGASSKETLPIKTSNVNSDQTDMLDKGVQQQEMKKGSPLLQQAGVSFITFLIGYIVSFGVLGSLMDVSQVVPLDTNIVVQLICCAPAMIPTAFIITTLVMFIQGRFKLSSRATLRVNAIASLVIGFIAYIPGQFLLLMGAAL